MHQTGCILYLPADGPHLDSSGHPDARTAASLEAELLQLGGKAVCEGLIEFSESNSIHQVTLTNSIVSFTFLSSLPSGA